ncbi:sigma-70 family RNA polymerase sigma factor [Chitinophagaceae bacterium LWZ2-11]
METVAKIKTGDAKVFKEVFYNYSQKLYNFLYEKTKSEYYANEVVQLTFIKIWKNRTQLNDDVKLSTQIFQIAKTTLIDELRKEERYKIKVEHLRSNKNLFKQTETGYAVIDANDLNASLHRAIEVLPPVRKKVFRLNKIQQLTYKEISTEMSISVKTVDKHIQLALRNIKPFLGVVLAASITLYYGIA